MQKVLQYVFNLVLRDEQIIAEQYKKSERTKYHYYMGKFFLIEHKIEDSAKHLEKAFILCHNTRTKNKRLIMINLLTTKIILGIFPKNTDQLLKRYSLHEQFYPVITAVKAGNISMFSTALDGDLSKKKFFMRNRIYNPLKWRCIMPIYRNLLRKTFKIGSALKSSDTVGFESSQKGLGFGFQLMGDDTSMESEPSSMKGPPPKIMFEDFFKALRLSGYDFIIDSNQLSKSEPTFDQFQDEVIAILSRLIEAGFVKGYVSLSSKCVVVSRKQAFPLLSSAISRQMSREMWWSPREIVDRRSDPANDEEDDD